MIKIEFGRFWPKQVVRIAAASAFAVTLWTAGASAQLKNGDFTSLGGLNAAQSEIGGPNGLLPNWTISGNANGIDCVMINPNSPGNFSATTSTAMCGTSYGAPAGAAHSYGSFTQNIPALPVSYAGNIIVADAFTNFSESLSQQVSLLSPNTTYTLSFYFTGAQQSGFTGPSQDSWQVCYGVTSCTSTVTTPTITIPDGGGSAQAWQKESFNFTTTNAGQQFFSFLAQGNAPANEPPFMFLADVTATRAPEPASIALLGIGLAGLAGLRRRAHRSGARV